MKDRLLKESDVMEAINKRVEELLNDPVFVRKKGYIDVFGIKKHILAIPSADRPQGEWINGHSTNGIYYKRCDQCFAEIEETFFAYDFDVNYCPNCGARMFAKDINVRSKDEPQTDCEICDITDCYYHAECKERGQTDCPWK